jgi:hypothetical protein
MPASIDKTKYLGLPSTNKRLQGILELSQELHSIIT